jgi:DNA-binding transcriptional LysR family regulator
MSSLLEKTMALLDPQLNVFLALCHHKSMHQTAKAIHLSQTAITQRIRSLENRLKTTLFLRTPKGVVLTSDGEALLRYCQTVKSLEGETLAKINGAGIHSTTRVAITGPTSIMESRIIPQCLPLMHQFPEVVMTFDINDSTQRIKSLQTGETHFAILEPHLIPKEFKIKMLTPENYVLVCSSQWKNRSLHDILTSERIIDFDENDVATFQYLKHYQLIDSIQSTRHFANRTDSLVKMFIAQCGYGVLTLEFSQQWVKTGELMVLNEGQVYQNTMALAWYDRPTPPHYFSAFVDIIE